MSWLEEATQRYREAIAGRARREGSVTLVALPEPVEAPSPLSPGSILVVYAPARSERLARASQAASARDLRALRSELTADGGFDAEQLPEAGETGFDVVPAFAELLYGERLLLTGMHVLPWALDGLGSWTLAFSGGETRAEEFATFSYCLGDAEPLDVLLVANPPFVSDFEKRLVAAVASDDFASHVLAEPAAVPAAAATVVAAWAANKALDAAYDYAKAEAKERGRDWAAAHERRIAEARAEGRQRQLEQARANRTRYRNADAVEMPDDVVSDLTEGLDPAAGVEALLRVRRELLTDDR